MLNEEVIKKLKNVPNSTNDEIVKVNTNLDNTKVALNDKIGDTTLLETTDKTSLVNALNEVKINLNSIETKAEKISIKDTDNFFSSDNVEGALKELFQNVDNGKNLIASAITDKGINTSKDDTFQKIAENINKLVKLNHPPILSNITVSNIKVGGSYTLNYTCTDEDKDTLIHRLKIGDNDFISINPSNNDNNFTYIGNGLSHNTSYTCYIEVSDGDKIVLSNPFTITIPKAEVYGVKIDESNSNPLTCVTYIESSQGIIPANSTGYEGWSNIYPFKDIKPCGFKSGKLYKYINPQNFSKYLDGSDVSGDVDVMIEFPKIYWKFTTTTNGYEIRISEARIDNNYICMAHTVGSTEKEKIYIGAYLGYNIDGKLRSVSGYTPTVSKTIGEFRLHAQANGSGYQQYNYYSMLMLQILYLIMYKSLNSQVQLGFGYTDESEEYMTTGETNSNGMIYGSNGKKQIKFLGIEDLWGNYNQWVDGFYSDNDLNMMISDNSIFNDKGTGYINRGQGANQEFNGSISKVQATNHGGFIIKSSDNGASDKYYCDAGALFSDSVPITGGFKGIGSVAGIFLFMVSYSSSYSDNKFTSRLVYM